MKSIKFGNLVEEVQKGIIVHGCNAQGVMASGIAKEIREKYPENYEAYHEFCKAQFPKKKNLLGQVCWYQPKPGLWIANAITQLNYGRDPTIQYVDYQAVQTAFRTITQVVVNNMHNEFEMAIKTGVESIDEELFEVHYPTIGAGLGNGDWAIINDIIQLEFDSNSGMMDLDRTLWLLPQHYM
jgi:O-acetyl-ADP-ribose deacetylase (regulator of RNase III)